MKLNFCLEYGTTLAKESDTKYTCENGHPYWNNPRATVAVALLRNDKILVSKRANKPYKGKYDLPGGFLEYGEDVLGAARREIKEEAGLEINDLRIVAAYTGFYDENESVCDLVIVAKSWNGTPVAQDDSAALEWQPLSFLESKDFAPNYVGLGEILKSTL